MLKSVFHFCGLFLIILLYFVFSNGWYEKEQLIIKGTSEIGGAFDVQWDSGSGFNRYEKKHIPFKLELPAGQHLPIVVKYLGEKKGQLAATNIMCSEIHVDRKELDISCFVGKGDGIHSGKGVLLNKQFNEFEMSVPATSSVEIEFLTNNRSGKVELSVGSDTITNDLYIANVEAKTRFFQYWLLDEQNKFEIYLDLPRYAVKTFRIHNTDTGKNMLVDSIELSSKGKRQSVDFVKGNNATDVSFNLSKTRKKHHFNILQFIFQFFFALLSAWIFLALWLKLKKAGGIVELFKGEKKIFWLLGIGAGIAHAFWLVAFWPGVMSVDSLKIWRAALLPEVFLNDHPLLNVVLYLYLGQIWQNPAIIPIFHICMMSLLTGYVFSSVYQQGIELKLLLPFYFILIFSIPVGLYNIVLWKDIPFAILIVFWAFTLADLYREKCEGKYCLSLQKKAVLILLLIALALTRHNGIIYLGIIPLFCIFLGLVDIKKALFPIACVVLMFGCTGIVLKLSGVIVDFDYLFIQTSVYAENVFANSISTLSSRIFENYWGILNINQTASKWDLWHYFLGDRTAYSFLVHAQWSDVYPYLPDSAPILNALKNICMEIYWKTYDVPWVFLTWNPIYVLVILPLSLLFFRKVPLTAIFSAVILVQVLVLLLINVLNWRYYYFVCLGGLFLGPMLLLDLKRRGIDRLKTS